MPIPRDATRRKMLQAGLATLSGAVAAGHARAADNDAVQNAPAQQPAAKKFSPEEVQYQGAPNGWRKCIYCMFFKEPDVCSILTAPVTRDGWCNHFSLLHE